MAHARVDTSHRSTRSRLAAHVLHSKYDSRDLTAAARAAFMARFEKQVDPDRCLDPIERSRRAEHAKKAHFLAMAIRSAKARSASNGESAS